VTRVTERPECEDPSVPSDAASDLEILLAAIAAHPLPVCAELTPFDVVAADRTAGTVRLEFAPQPAFGNHFGDIQGGFVVAMLDVPLSLAALLATDAFCPTVEIKTTFLARAGIGVCAAEGRVLKAGRQLVFTEARLWGPDGKLAAHATATAVVPG
jgi:uncharacterized protein (TIGR00369 family)